MSDDVPTSFGSSAETPNVFPDGFAPHVTAGMTAGELRAQFARLAATESYQGLLAAQTAGTLTDDGRALLRAAVAALTEISDAVAAAEEVIDAPTLTETAADETLETAADETAADETADETAETVDTPDLDVPAVASQLAGSTDIADITAAPATTTDRPASPFVAAVNGADRSPQADMTREITPAAMVAALAEYSPDSSTTFSVHLGSQVLFDAPPDKVLNGDMSAAAVTAAVGRSAPDGSRSPERVAAVTAAADCTPGCVQYEVHSCTAPVEDVLAGVPVNPCTRGSISYIPPFRRGDIGASSGITIWDDAAQAKFDTAWEAHETAKEGGDLAQISDTYAELMKCRKRCATVRPKCHVEASVTEIAACLTVTNHVNRAQPEVVEAARNALLRELAHSANAFKLAMVNDISSWFKFNAKDRAPGLDAGKVLLTVLRLAQAKAKEAEGLTGVQYTAIVPSGLVEMAKTGRELGCHADDAILDELAGLPYRETPDVATNGLLQVHPFYAEMPEPGVPADLASTPDLADWPTDFTINLVPLDGFELLMTETIDVRARGVNNRSETELRENRQLGLFGEVGYGLMNFACVNPIALHITNLAVTGRSAACDISLPSIPTGGTPLPLGAPARSAGAGSVAVAAAEVAAEVAAEAGGPVESPGPLTPAPAPETGEA